MSKKPTKRARALRIARKADGGEVDTGYINPVTGDPVTPQYVKSVHAAMEGLRQMATTPGAAMKSNPYPAGSEEAAWYDQNRQDTMNNWAPAMATSMVGAGAPAAEVGALGVGGGRTIMPGGTTSLRGPGGKFIKPMTDGRGMPNPFVPDAASYKMVKPGEVAPTAEPVNPMYTAENAPDPAAAAKLMERQGSDTLNVNPLDVSYWRSQIPNAFAFRRGGSVRHIAKADGGGVFSGYIHGATGGRTDNKDINVASGSYIIPADILSGIGEGNSHAGADALMRQLKMGPYDDAPSIVPKAGGGAVGQPVPIVAASGELAIPPDKVAELGGGDVDRGHQVLDAFVSHTRKKTIKTLKSLPKPKKD